MAAGIAVGILIDPARGVGGRGRDARGAVRAARGRVRDRRETHDRHDRGSCSRRRSPAIVASPDPRVLARGRGDDDRRARGRRDRAAPCAPSTRSSGGQTMTGAIASLAIGSDQVRGSGVAPSTALYFVGLLLFAITLRPQRDVASASSAACGGTVLMSLVAPGATTRTSVDLALRGQAARPRRDACSASLLLADAAARARDPADPAGLTTLQRRLAGARRTRGADFVRSDTSQPASNAAGVWQGLVGSLILIGFVAVHRAADRDRGGRLPAGVRARHAAEPAPDREHPEPRAACRRSCTASSASSCSCRRCGASPAPTSSGASYISGGLTLAVLVMPIVILITMEALRAVPSGHPRGRLRGRRHAVGGRAEPRAPVRGARRSSPARSCRSPARSARPRRSCSWAR